jgi:PelA/Pel-15E family pectate lyase
MQPVKSASFAVWLALVVGCPLSLPAAIIGTNPPALALTTERVAGLPAAERAAWTHYLQQSEQQWQADQQFFVAELKKHGLKESVPPPHGGSGSRPPLRKPAAWYRQPEARQIADNLLSFQTPAGGWSKNVDMTQHRRAPGEQFTGSDTSVHMDPKHTDLPRDLHWSYVGTFDNDATTTQLRYLAKVVAATDPGHNAAYRQCFLHGLDYVLAAQYPNGGWPQVWPLEGGYHDAITYNDGAMINVLELLRDVAEGASEFAWVPPHARKASAASVKRGVTCVLASQIAANGCRTVWCQQHDALTLQPTSARNYEMPSQSGPESAEVVSFLMQLPNPDPNTVAAVHAAAKWFHRTGLPDLTFQRIGTDDRQLVHSPGAGLLWARYYMIGTDRPLFGDRDKTIHDNVMDISKERRRGYSWFSERPSRMLEAYRRWKETHPPAVNQTS